MGSVVLFALVLFVVGGVTAYMGDKLGSYIGKKRHSSFGLRPRHTAMLWTVVSGGAIAVGTLALLFILDNTVKTALLEGPELVAQKSLLEHQNTALTHRNSVTEQLAQADNLRAMSAQNNADAAQQALGTVSGELKRARTILTQSRSNLSASEARLTARQAALVAAQSQLTTARLSLVGTHADLTRAEDRVRLARRGVESAQSQFRLARSQALQADKEVLRASRNLLALGIRQDKLHMENVQLVQQNLQQKSLLQNSQGHMLIFRREEELGRTIVSSRQSPDSLRRELAVFLDQIELSARQRGAGGLDNSPALVIPNPTADAEGDAAAREAALDALTQNIADQSGMMPSIVVVAAARFNTFRGEAVKVDLRPFSNILVFAKDTVIAESAIDGTQPDDIILRRLQAFLVERVRPVALSRGIIPVLDPESGEAQVGQPIDSVTWLARVKQIRALGANARVTAFSSEDTFSGDLLHLDLKVTGQEDPAGSRVPMEGVGR